MLQAETQAGPPIARERAADCEQSADELFERERHEHLGAADLAGALESLLSRYPDAPVAALKADGVLVAMPASMPLRENPVLEARSGLDLVAHEDRLRLLATWDRLLACGAARCLAHLASDPATPMVFYGLDLRESHGVVLTVFVPADPGAGPRPESPEAPAPPRFATVVKDERSFIIETDESISEILGWSAEELLGRRSIEFIHQEDHPLAIDNWMEMLASPGPGRRVRLRHRHRDGGWVWLEVTNHNLLDDPDEQRVLSEIVDISEEMAAHEELRAREQLLDRLAAAIPLGLFQVDVERRIVYTNGRLHEILGVERAPTAEAQLATVRAADHPLLQLALSEVLDEGRAVDVEVELQLTPERQLRFCSISLRPLTHEDGTLSGAIACVSDVTDSTRMREELSRRATFDELTGCYNRASIVRALEHTLNAESHGSGMAVMFLDLDGFKTVNDLQGHAAGDELLRILGERLRAVVREEDMVGRVGGDEFLIVCPSLSAPEKAMTLAGRLADALCEEVALPASRLAPRVSIGVAWSDRVGEDADRLVAQADGAMYRSKHGGAGRPVLASA